MAVYEETIDLKDGISATAKSASSQVKILEDAIKSTQTAMVKAGATGNVGQYKKLTKDLSAYKATLSTLPPVLGEASAATSSASSSAGGLQAELAEMTGGLSIAVEAVAAVGAAFGALVFAGAALAIEAAELKEKMTSLFDALGEGQISGKQTIAMLDELGDSIGQTRKQIAPFAQSFMAMGVTGVDQLRQLTLAAASAGALAEGGGEAFTKMFKKINAATATGQALKIPLKGLGSLADMGLNVDDVAKKMGISAKELGAQLKGGSVNAQKFGDAMQSALIDKGAGPLQKAGAALSNVWGKFQENMMKLFEDIEVGPFLEEVKSLFDIFGQAQPSGQALKSGIGAFFKEVFSAATKVVPLVKHFLLDVVIYGLKAYLAVKPIIKSFNEWRQTASGMKTISTIIGTIGSVLITVATVIGVAIGAFLALWAVMVGIGVVIWAFIAAVIEIPQMAGAALAEFFGKAPQMALDFVKGLADGIANGGSMVVNAVKGLASGAVDSFKGALGIHSPSKVMMELGGHTGTGFAQGLDDTAGDVHASAAGISSAAFAGASSGGSGGAAAPSGGGGAQISVQVTIEGAGKSALEITEEMVAAVFERVALGAGV